MKLPGSFGFFPALFALVLLFSGCDALPFGSDNNNNTNSNNTPATNNGSIFYKQAPDSKFVIISVYSNTSAGKFIEPKAGYKYALAIVPLDSSGNLVFSGQTDSEGALTAAADGKFNFVPDNPSQEAGVGEISDGKLTMDKVPGYPSYTKLSMNWLKDAVITATAPFPSVNIPNTGDDDDDSDGTDVSRDPVFRPGSYVTGVKFRTAPAIKTAYQGMAVELPSGTQVEISYKDGSATSVTVDKKNFIIEPPYYNTAGSTHTIKYIGEYVEQSVAFPTFTAPKHNPADKTTADRTYFYTLNNARITGDNTIKYFEGYGFDLSEVTITVDYIYDKYDNDGKPITPRGEEKNKNLTAFTATQTGTGTGTLNYGNTNSSIVYADYALSDIIITDAAFKEQITFDDPRFFDEEDKLNYWYSHLSDAKIGLIYQGTTKQQEIRVVEAAMKLVPDAELELTPPSSWDDKRLIFKYGNTNKQTNDLDIPLYNTLASLAVESKNGKKIVLNGALPDNETSFLNQVNVYAIYQMGNNKNNTVRKPVFVLDKFAAFNSLCINGVPETNVKTAGILNSSSSNSYNKNGRLQKATVTLTSYNGYEKLTATTPGQTQKGTIQVGVTGY